MFHNWYKATATIEFGVDAETPEDALDKVKDYLSTLGIKKIERITITPEQEE